MSALAALPALALADGNDQGTPVDANTAPVEAAAPEAAPSAPSTDAPAVETPSLLPAPTPAAPSGPARAQPGVEAPQATDPELVTPGESKRRERRRTGGAALDPAPGAQATDPSLIGPSALEVQAVPNFFIEDFDIPPFLLPIYQAAGSEYGIRWEVLAAINRIETAFGTNLNVSSAGALGWMQFMPATWATYGVDANGDGEKDPFNPADAIFAAARYLKAAGGDQDLRKAIWAYNHADWYVDDVMEGASQVASIPEPIISSLAALTQGLFPVDAADRKVDYRGKINAKGSDEKVAPGDDASDTVEGDAVQNGIQITAPAGSRVVAVADGVIEKVGQSERLGTFIRIRDAYGNRYTYANLGTVQDKVPVPKPSKDDHEGHDHSEQEPGTGDAPTPTAPATDAAVATTPATDAAPTTPASDAPAATSPAATPAPTPVPQVPVPHAAAAKHMVDESDAIARAERQAAGDAGAAVPADLRTSQQPVKPDGAEGGELTDAALAEYFSIEYGLKASEVELRSLKAGRQVIAGTVLGRMQPATTGPDASLTFEIRPAGADAPRIDPKPILDGWRLMERTAFYRAKQQEAVRSGDASGAANDATPAANGGPADATAGQVLLMSKAELQQRVLADKRISIYECGRRDIKAGLIDRRVLALLQYLAVKGVQPSVTSLQCGHGYLTASGNVSEHTTGTAVDIATAYGKVISPATQGPGSPTDRAVQEILKLQGAMKPHQIITLMTYEGADNTLAMADHDDHIHVGYRPSGDAGGGSLGAGPAGSPALEPGDWRRLIERVGKLRTPKVRSTPSDAATPATTPSSSPAPRR